MPAAYSIRLLSPGVGDSGEASASFSGGLALADGPRAANQALIVQADTAADAARRALSGAVTVSFQEQSADYAISPDLIGNSLSEHLPFLLGQPDAEHPELWRIALEDLAAGTCKRRESIGTIMTAAGRWTFAPTRSRSSATAPACSAATLQRKT